MTWTPNLHVSASQVLGLQALPCQAQKFFFLMDAMKEFCLAHTGPGPTILNKQTKNKDDQ